MLLLYLFCGNERKTVTQKKLLTKTDVTVYRTSAVGRIHKFHQAPESIEMDGLDSSGRYSTYLEKSEAAATEKKEGKRNLTLTYPKCIAGRSKTLDEQGYHRGIFFSATSSVWLLTIKIALQLSPAFASVLNLPTIGRCSILIGNCSEQTLPQLSRADKMVCPRHMRFFLPFNSHGPRPTFSLSFSLYGLNLKQLDGASPPETFVKVCKVH